MKLSDALKLFDENESDATIRKECLITREEIKNEITLKCNHSFEYDALLKNIFGCQQNYHYHKCPYCRKVNSGFIPYCQHPDDNKMGEELLNTIDQTMFKKNEYITWSYCFSSGKNNGKPCGKGGQKFNLGNYCFAHYKQTTKQKSPSENTKKQCCKILKNGNQCKLKCFNHDTGLCKRHEKLNKDV